jgi:mono/diheme cytochrome c family protein
MTKAPRQSRKEHHMMLTSMRIFRRLLYIGLVALLLSAPCGVENVWADMTGRQDFVENCASCHGIDGKGHGKARDLIPGGVKPPDLTELSKANAGTFPAEQVYRWIDGRTVVTAHSRIDMPFWGTVMQQSEKEFRPESEAMVKVRILRMVSYIESIQQK